MSTVVHSPPKWESKEMAMIVSRMYFGALTESAPWHCIWERQVQMEDMSTDRDEPVMEKSDSRP